MKKVLNMTYASSLTDLCEVNSSFDSGVLRIAYAGKNRNGSHITKEAFERCARTMYNCPIVTNYDRESDSLGGHDIELVRDTEGRLKLVNKTVPVGCIPESARYWWDIVTEDDGTSHEYLYVDALLWKRQEAYEKIKRDGVTAHSMEITVKDGEVIDGIYYIYDFEFNAFALIGVEPCFESASLEVFSANDFKQQLSEMMQDLKEQFDLVTASDEDHDNNNTSEGGDTVLDENKIGFNAADADDNEMTDNIDAKIAEVTEDIETVSEAGAEEAMSETSDSASAEEYALTNNVVEEIMRSLYAEKVMTEYGEQTRYWYVDCDLDKNEVYCWDTNDWLLYGFMFAMNGDNVEIDYQSKSRKKYTIADFDEGAQVSPFAETYSHIVEALSDIQSKYQAASDMIESMRDELDELRQYKLDAEKDRAIQERETIFAQFEDLVGVEAFDALREKSLEYDTETLEEKCYAIRGRQGVAARFALETTAHKILVETTSADEAPYGGVVEKYIGE